MGDTTPPDLRAFGFEQQINPPLRAPEFVNYLNRFGLLGPQAALAIRAIQELGHCVADSKVAQWAVYTRPGNRLTIGFLFKASKNGLTNPDAMLGCVKGWLSPKPQTAQFQLCHSMGHYIDGATGDTVFTGYLADDDALCGALIGHLAQVNYTPYY